MFTNDKLSFVQKNQCQQSICVADHAFFIEGLYIGADLLCLKKHVLGGHVQACFDRAIHILLEDQRLLTLLCGASQHGMRMVNIAPAAWGVLHQYFSSNDAITFTNNALQHKYLTLSWETAYVWHSPEIKSYFCHTDTPVLHAQLEHAQRWLAQKLTHKAMYGNVAWKAAHSSFMKVVNALQPGVNDLHVDLERAVCNTVGLGPGLTPSGDDMLAGLMLGLMLGHDARSSLLSTLIFQYIKDTTYASQDNFDQICSGWLTARFADVILALNRTNISALNKALSAQGSIGHYSGLDSLIGLFSGLKTALFSHCTTLPSTPFILSV